MGIIICFVIAAVLYILGGMHLKEKGLLLNNAFLYASAEERKTMDKKPHYRQSGIVFLFLGTIFVLNALQIITMSGWIFGIIIVIVAATLVYAVVSSILIEKNNKNI
ncbi:MAG: DUF3784 domain-containing protein [Lachnospiraceae bacterium]